MNDDEDCNVMELKAAETLFTLMSCVALKRLKSQGWSGEEALAAGRTLTRRIMQAVPELMQDIGNELAAAYAANGFNEEIFTTMASAAAAVRAVEIADSQSKLPEESAN